MTALHNHFDWNRWYASIPGIPLDWGAMPQPNAMVAKINAPKQLVRRAPLPRPANCGAMPQARNPRCAGH